MSKQTWVDGKALVGKQQKPPERIYLQHDPENTGEPFSEAAEVTWCKDRIYDTDQEYIRADLVRRRG
jgi:hypothetical protein